jgi:cbb3-type cytochrome oxidase subunit 3
MASRAALRASDADRERVAERLRQAAAEGRLLTEELEHRLEASFSARTYGQLNAIVADLPGRHLSAPAEAGKLTWARPALAAVIAVAATLAVIVAVLAVTGVLAMWMLWLFVGWWFFGYRRRRLHGARYARSMHACGAGHGGRSRARSYWV